MLEELFEEWHKDTCWMSSIQQIQAHENFKSIIEHPGIIDFCLDNLEKDEYVLLCLIALGKLKGTLEMPYEIRGYVRKMADWYLEKLRDRDHTA